jgi:beta-aspartyl-peptidase (threonine type)
MKKILYSLLLLLSIFACKQNNSADAKKATQKPDYAIVIHGGVGTILRSDVTPEKEAAYTQALNEALDTGENILKNGGTSMDAVTATISYLEDCPLFNAGKGAVFTAEGKNELDASIMDGQSQKAGAVGGVTTVKNPITLARAVMEKSPHVMLTGRGAEQFAKEQGITLVDPSYFFTQPRWDTYLRAKAEDEGKQKEQQKILEKTKNIDKKFGTVGCVCLDKSGNIAAGTSTGGMTYKKWNRIGDAPIIGAGTYADNNSCGVSCTGHGEFFIRYTVARDVCALMEYKGMSVEKAADYVINDKLKSKGGEGGLIALDAFGNIAMAFNQAGMYRGFRKSTGEKFVGIFK